MAEKELQAWESIMKSIVELEEEEGVRRTQGRDMKTIILPVKLNNSGRDRTERVDTHKCEHLGSV